MEEAVQVNYAAQTKSLNNGRSRMARRRLQQYYLRQSAIQSGMQDVDLLQRGELTVDSTEEDALARRALFLSFAANIVLLGVRVAVAVLSGSLSLIVALMDAVLDVLSSSFMFWAAKQANSVDIYRYPVGKHRYESLGVVIFSTIMGTAAFTLIVEGVRQLIEPHDGLTETLNSQWLVVGFTIFVVGFKFLLYLYCRRSKSAAVQAFATDHLNDVFVNSLSLVGALLGAYVAWQADPSIAIALACYVLFSWSRQAYGQVRSLVGIAAPHEFLQKLTYLATVHHAEQIVAVDTVRAYTIGEMYLAEVDIVLPGDMTLKEAHDIGEDLQIKIESLPEVGRAFVHLDYEGTHRPEHQNALNKRT
ncbi:hypothetical protein MP228_003708 [Amoeboaphelidium protococcarum]|nr:hypothetical protein MP228_003708 [Amoeboaphelidium protococcarum]